MLVEDKNVEKLELIALYLTNEPTVYEKHGARIFAAAEKLAVTFAPEEAVVHAEVDTDEEE